MAAWMFCIPALFLLLAGTAQAEIYEWRDAVGSRHFTNSVDEVPAEQRNTMRVIVREPIRTEVNVPVPAPATTASEEEPPRQAMLVYDRAATTSDYAAGLRDGLALAAGGGQPRLHFDYGL